MNAGSFLPPQPLPNSVKAKQIEEQELAAAAAQNQPTGVDPQMEQMQKAQQAAVNELQQAQQQLAQTKNELQSVQAQSQQQQQAMQAQAQQEVQKAQMDAQYELQSEKIKNQQKLLSVQEKYMRSAGKAKPDQNHILSNQLKRVVKKVNSIKTATVTPPAAPNLSPKSKDSAIQAKERNLTGLPHAGVVPSQRTQQQWNEISAWKRNRIATDPKFQKIREQGNAAPVKTPGLVEGFGEAMGDYLDNPWKEYDTFKDNAFGAYDESKGMGDNLKANPLGSIGRLATNITTGFVPNLVGGLGEAAKGVYNLDPMRAAKGIGTATLGVGEGLLTFGTLGAGGAVTKGLQLPGRALAAGAKKVLPAASQKAFQSGLGKGVASAGKGVANVGAIGGVYAGADKLGLGDPNIYKQENIESTPEDYQDMNGGQNLQNISGGQNPYNSMPGGFSAPQPQQSWDAGLSPAERFSVMNQAQDMNSKGASVPSVPGDAAKEVEYPDIRKFMKNPPPPGEYIASPIPILQSGFKQHEFNMPDSRQQGYGPLGDFIKQLIFQVGLPAFGMRNPLEPDFERLYGGLTNNEAYKFKTPMSF